MSKATTKGTHWLPRHSQYSLHGQRNGRVDVLPPQAIESLYDIANQIADGKQRVAELREERGTLEAELHSLSRIDSLRDRHESRRAAPNPKVASNRRRIEDIGKEVRRVLNHVGELNALLGARREVTFEGAFVQVARVELSEAVWRSLSNKALTIVSAAKESGR